MYSGKFENEKRCVEDKYWRPFELVDYESELKNIFRTASRCPSKKFNPECKMDGRCIRTDDERNPIVLAPEVCPILVNNIPKFYDQPLLHSSQEPFTNVVSPNQIQCSKKN
jgi:hypothetical protein